MLIILARKYCTACMAHHVASKVRHQQLSNSQGFLLPFFPSQNSEAAAFARRKHVMNVL